MSEQSPKKGGPGVPIDVAALQAARAQLGWSQKKLAFEIGCEARVIERIESRGTAALTTLAHIAEVLGIEVQNLRPSPARAPVASPFVTGLLQLPRVLEDFTGRQDLIEMLAGRLRGDAGTFRLSALWGMGGIGKTSLATRVAHEVKNSYPDAQLFLDLRGMADGVTTLAVTPVEAMTQIARAFSPAADLPEDEQQLAGTYRGILAGKRALIVLDNVGSHAQVRSLLTAAPPVAFLVTSRQVLALDGEPPVQVGQLPPAEAYSMLRGIVATRGTQAEITRIVELCGHLPLGVRVAGDFVRLKEDWPVSRYIAALSEERERLRWLKIGDDPEKDVEVVLKLSSAQLMRDSVDRATRWHQLYVVQGDFDLAMAASAWNADENDIGTLDDLSDMKNRSLIFYDPNTARYRLHDLFRPIAEGLFT